MDQWQLLKANTICAKRENTCEQVVIGFDFASDWLSRYSTSFFKPITGHILESKTNNWKQFQITFGIENCSIHQRFTICCFTFVAGVTGLSRKEKRKYEDLKAQLLGGKVGFSLQIRLALVN